MKPLRIATDSEALPKGWGRHWLLAPLFDPNLGTHDSDRPYRKILRRYHQNAHELFELSSLEEADLAIVPADWSTYQGGFSWAARPQRSAIQKARKFSAAAMRLGKPVLVFFSGERSHERVPLPAAWVFRMSMYRSRAGERDVAIPAVFYQDILAISELETPLLREWHAMPSVGFCGFSRRIRPAERFRDLGFRAVHLVRERRPGISQFRGLMLRDRALEVLAASDKVGSRLLARPESVFFGTRNDPSFRDSIRREYAQYMITTDYQLSVRGSANYSRRPWEAMSAGRVPLFLDTDCVLPFADELDWSKLMVIVPESDLDRLPEATREFHESLDQNSYRALQLRCREVWEEYLSPLGFARWLSRFCSQHVVR